MPKNKGAAHRLLEKLGGAGTSTHVFTGMVKAHPKNNDAIMFARPGDSSRWVTIPVSQVQDLQFVHTVQSEGQTLPVIHLHLKDPQSSDGKTFADLASLHSVLPPGATGCYYDYGSHRWVCPT
jgi:hypothetical protein